MIDRPKGRIAPWMADRMKLPPASVLGTADVAALLGVTRQRVSQLKKDPTFPKAGMHYGRVGSGIGPGSSAGLRPIDRRARTPPGGSLETWRTC